MFENPEIRSQTRAKSISKLNQLFDELDVTTDKVIRNNIKRDIRQIVKDEGMSHVKFPQLIESDDDLNKIKDALRKKLKK